MYARCFGKHFGKTINDVMEQDPSYLVWFARSIRNMPDFVEQIKSHSQFPNAWAAYMSKEAAIERRRLGRTWTSGQYEGDGQGYEGDGQNYEGDGQGYEGDGQGY